MKQLHVEPVGRTKLSPQVPPPLQRAGVRVASSPAFMRFDAFCRLVDKLAPPLELHLRGEEPLLHPRFLDMVAYAAQRGIAVEATTRLPAFTARRAEACVKSGLRRLNVALGPQPSGLAQRGLQRLEEAKRRLNSDLPEIVMVDASQ